MTSSQPFKSEAPEESQPDAEISVRRLLVEYKTLISVSTVILIGATVLTDWSPEIPPWVRLYGTVAAASLIIGYPLGKKVVSWLYERPHHVLLDLDAREDGWAEWEISPEQLGQLHVCGAESLPTKRTMDGEIYLGRHLRELEEGEEDPLHPFHESDDMNDGEPVHAPEDGWYVNGTWRVTMDDLEVEREIEKLDETRRTLELEAMRGLAERVKMPGATRTGIREIVRIVIRGLERGTIHHGQDLQDIVDRTMQSYRMDRYGSSESQQDGQREDGVSVGDLDADQLQEALTASAGAENGQEVRADD